MKSVQPGKAKGIQMLMGYYDNILLLGAVIAIIANIIQIISYIVSNRSIFKENWRDIIMKHIIAIMAILATITSIGIIAYATGGAFLNEQLTQEAWRSLTDKDYETTIETAEKCVTLFHDEALQEQKLLSENGVPEPPKGKVNETQKKEIFSRGLLNDVAACWYILGKAHASIGNAEQAKKSFTKVLLFPHGRCFDPSKNIFWAPSDGAKIELEKLNGKSIYD